MYCVNVSSLIQFINYASRVRVASSISTILFCTHESFLFISAVCRQTWYQTKMDWLFGYVDTLDIIVLTVIAIIAGYVFTNYRSENAQDSSSTAANGSAVMAPKVDRSFLGRMKSENRQVLILFGSQTGTAEELAGRLAKDLHRYGKKPLVMDPEEIDIEDLPKITGN